MYNDLKGGKGVKLINGFGGFDKLGGGKGVRKLQTPTSSISHLNVHSRILTFLNVHGKQFSKVLS